MCECSCRWLRAQQRLDRPPLVHRGVRLRCLLKGQGEVEDLAWVDLAVADKLDQFRQEPAYRRGSAEQVHLREEQLLAGQRDAVSDADVADMPAGTGGTDRLHHRLLRTDGLDDGVRAEAAGELREPSHSFVTALDDDVGGAVLASELLPVLVPAEDDDALRSELLGGEHAEQPDGAVADDGDGLAGTRFRGDSAEPAGAEHVRGGEQAWDEVVIGHPGSGDESPVGERNAGVLSLRARGRAELADRAAALEAGLAYLAGVVRGHERADDELTWLDAADVAADLLDDADVLMAHRARLLHRVDAAVWPQVGSADAGRRQPDDRVGRLLDGRVRTVLDSDVARCVHNGSTHEVASLGSCLR